MGILIRQRMYNSAAPIRLSRTVQERMIIAAIMPSRDGWSMPCWPQVGIRRTLCAWPVGSADHDWPAMHVYINLAPAMMKFAEVGRPGQAGHSVQAGSHSKQTSGSRHPRVTAMFPHQRLGRGRACQAKCSVQVAARLCQALHIRVCLCSRLKTWSEGRAVV